MRIPRPSLVLAAAVLTALPLAAATSSGAAPGAGVEDPPTVSADGALLSLSPIGTHRTGEFDVSAAEIVAFHAATKRTFVVNALSGHVDVLDAADPTAPTKIATLDVAGTAAADGSTIPTGAVVNSLDVRRDGLAVVAVEAPTKTDPGWLALADASSLDVLGAVRVGALPDMVELTPDGDRAVVANEGEPADDFSVDPEGSVAVVDLPSGVAAVPQSAVRIADFHAYEEDGPRTLPEGVRVFGPTVNTERPVSANLEPEYVAVGADGRTAYAALQEANAVAVVDLASATVTDVWAMGSQDHSLTGHGIDASDRDGTVDIRPRPVRGLHMPDGLVSYQADGSTYLVSANEGDAREWGDYVEGARVKDLGKKGLAPLCADNPAVGLTSDAELGRLNVSTASGLDADRGCYEQLYSFGTRSFSIWTPDGTQVFDSGDAFERITAEAAPEFFNSNHTESNLEGRSDDKGPEPEGVAVGEVGGRTYAFVGFERVGGVAVFDVTSPKDSSFVTYVNNRDFSVSVGAAADPAAVLDDAGDLGPEGVTFVAPKDSPTGQALVVVGNEVSGTTTFFGVEAAFASSPAPTISGEPVVGEELTAEVEDWSPEATFAYQWQSDGEDVEGATEATYTVRAADVGSRLTVAVTGTAPGLTPTTRTSEAVVAEAGEESTLVVELDVEQAAPGDTVTGTVSGAAAEEELDVSLHSDPVDLGTVTADADGTAALSFEVPEAEPGEHTVVVEGASGRAEAPLEVLAAAPGTDDGSDGGGTDTGGGLLPDAGGPALLLAVLGALAIGTGATLARRRRA